MTMTSPCFGVPALAVHMLCIIAVNGYGSWISIAHQAQSTLSTRARICDQMQLNAVRRKKCEISPQTIKVLQESMQLGIQMCQHQFRNDRWNCSVLHNSQVVNPKIMKKTTKEAAFFHAILSAAIVHAVTLSCSMGRLDRCGCDKRMSGNDTDGMGQFTWRGCSDDIRFGLAFARNLTDADERDTSDPRTKMNLHNTRAGRKAVQGLVKRQCKCHGLTGSCIVRSCWMQTSKFVLTGNELKRRYWRSEKVVARQHNSGVKLRLKYSRRAKLNPKDLVYLDDSPSYCNRNPDEGYPGTSGRECNNTSNDRDGCESMCCGRGYNTKQVVETYKCECKFHWCCSLHCKNCSRTVEVHTCKPEVTTVRLTSGMRPAGRGRRRKGKRRKNRKKKRPRKPRVRQRIARDLRILQNPHYHSADSFT